MGKVISSSEKPGFFPKGGSGKMFGKGTSPRSTPASRVRSRKGPSGGDKFPMGG